MQTKEYVFVDRTGWPSGEWDNEPDKVQWPDAETGLPCIARRNSHAGNWCGYVGVSEGHPLYGKHYDIPDLTVHGGLTFSRACVDSDDEHGICHVPSAGEPDHVWWFGFDCAHCYDFSPIDILRAKVGYPFTISADEKYRTLAYVKNQCTALARQLAAIRTDVQRSAVE